MNETAQQLAKDMTRGMQLHPNVKQIKNTFFEQDSKGRLVGACAFGFAVLGQDKLPGDGATADAVDSVTHINVTHPDNLPFAEDCGWGGLGGQIIGLNNGGTSMQDIIDWVLTL